MGRCPLKVNRWFLLIIIFIRCFLNILLIILLGFRWSLLIKFWRLTGINRWEHLSISGDKVNWMISSWWLFIEYIRFIVNCGLYSITYNTTTTNIIIIIIIISTYTITIASTYTISIIIIIISINISITSTNTICFASIADYSSTIIWWLRVVALFRTNRSGRTVFVIR